MSRKCAASRRRDALRRNSGYCDTFGCWRRIRRVKREYLVDLIVDLRACLAGRKDAWDAFVRASAPVIYAAVQRSIRSRRLGVTHPGDVDDRVQDVYVRLLREDARLLRTFDPRRASLATWLSIIARTVVHEHFQKKRLPTVALNEGDPDSSIPPTSAQHTKSPSSRHEQPTPNVSLDILTVQQRQVIEMLFDQDLSVEQAAARLGVDPQTIRSAKHKALTRLREAMFGEQGHAPPPDAPEALNAPEGRRNPPPAPSPPQPRASPSARQSPPRKTR